MFPAGVVGINRSGPPLGTLVALCPNPVCDLSHSPGRNGTVKAGRGASSPGTYPQYPERFVAVIKDFEGMADDSSFPDLFEIEYLLF